MPTVVRATDTRRTETPAAVMTTLASPTLGGAATAMWKVEVGPDAQPGPSHIIDAEQIWTFLTGTATVEIEGDSITLAPGDTVIIPADRIRRLTPDPATGFTAIVTAPANAAAARAETPTAYQTPPWIQ